jgi:hypothetical protein
MRRRQTVPHQWLIIRDAEDRVGLATARRLPRGSGVLLLEPLPAREMRRLRLRGLTFVEEQRGKRRSSAQPAGAAPRLDGPHTADPCLAGLCDWQSS